MPTTRSVSRSAPGEPPLAGPVSGLASIAFGAIAICLIASTAVVAQEGAAGVRTAEAGDTLSKLARRHLGDAAAWPAIMLATNARLGDDLGLVFIARPDALEIGQRVWVPGRSETAQVLAQWRTYEAAIVDAVLPQPWEIVDNLAMIDTTRQSVTVVAWAREPQYLAPLPQAAPGEMWVTVEPHLQEFCRSLPAASPLVLRLEQRLGLPPRSNKTKFVRIEVDPRGGGLFRPCPDPAIDVASCTIEPPHADPDVEHPLWFYRQYHADFGELRPTRFPWTALGYTYDWGDLAR